MIAVGIEEIDVESRLGRLNPRTHFLDEDLVTQALCLAHFIAVPRPRHGQRRWDVRLGGRAVTDFTDQGMCRLPVCVVVFEHRCSSMIFR
ncbi:hypothetical protein GALL_525170 [mine drainage metagenome]|uniref:Uncharacterized protein n=1 Tax=mine drainage metagenome TaxID=410659 RepID=A0A1J5P483_9ZZZZ